MSERTGFARLEESKELNERTKKLNESYTAKLRHSMLKLLTGDQLTAAEGRELFYEHFCNARVMQVDPMTGNANTYHRLGQRKWAEEEIRYLKDADIDLFQKAEKESVIRRKQQEEELRNG